MIHLNELRGLCDKYERKALSGMQRRFPDTQWKEMFEQARLAPESLAYDILRLALRVIPELELWANLDRFLWLCQRIADVERNK